MRINAFIVVLLVLTLLTINFSVAYEMDNSTSEDIVSGIDEDVLTVSDPNDAEVLQQSKTSTALEVKSSTDFDVIGDYFKVKLSDSNGKAISNTKVTFSVSGNTYNKNTDSKGIASLQLRLNDGTYKITTKFAGNSNYKSSSLKTTITITNTRVVKEGLSNSEIQNIIDNAKSNNIILFKGSSYSDINLVVNKCLTLQSNVNTVLKSNSGSVITINGKSSSLTTIKGFKIQSGGDGIVVTDSDYVTIVSNQISGKKEGISASNTKHLEISKNSIKNSKNGISLSSTENTYVHDNVISNNEKNGISVGKSKNTHIYDNDILFNGKSGILASNGPEKLYITQNKIDNNLENGITILKAGNDVKIIKNNINYNTLNGISLTKIGSNIIQSNIITKSKVGINFEDEYLKPTNQEISYNAIISNNKAVNANENYYYDFGERLTLGDNWYGDYGFVCPKIEMNNLKFVVKQIGQNRFAATFYDSNGNIASLLPDRPLTYQTNDGKIVTITISGGTGVFTVDASDNDLIKSTVDLSQRDNNYDSLKSDSDTSKYQGKSSAFEYPNIQRYQLYEDIDAVDNYDGSGLGSGSGAGEGSGGSSNLGNGNSYHESSDFTGNSTNSQKMNPSNNAANQINDVSQNTGESITSQASSSEAGPGDVSSADKSVVKQILLDEDDIVRVSGMLFITLLIIFSILFYYREDIKEMKSKI